MEHSVSLFDETWGRVSAPHRTDRGRLALRLDQVSARQFLAECARLHAENGQEDTKVVARVLAEFQSGQVLLLWNERQVRHLDEILDLSEDNTAVFLRIFPMQGG